MSTPAGYTIYLEMKKGFRPYSEAVQDEKYLREYEKTGELWAWVDRNDHQINGTEL